MNKLILIGNLTADPQAGTTESGTGYASFTIAVNRQYTDYDGNRACDFFNCRVYGKRADNCAKYLTKGSKVAVTGELRLNQVEGENGEKRLFANVFVNSIEYLVIRKNDEQVEPAIDEKREEVRKPEKPEVLMPVDNDEDMPF